MNTPSKYGSHKSMVNRKRTQELNNPNKCICIDEYGEYETDIAALDNGRADYARFNPKRMADKIEPRLA